MKIFHFFKYFSLPFIVVLFYSQTIHAGEDERSFDEAVSLGPHCQIAEQLHLNYVRHRAYPFDWIVTRNFDGLLNFIAQQDRVS